MSHAVRVALWVRLDAKPGKEAAVEDFLRAGLPLVQQESATIAWFGIKLAPSTFGIFDAFPDEAGRRAHLAGKVAAARMANASELLAKPPHLEKIDVLAAKLPGQRAEKAASPTRVDSARPLTHRAGRIGTRALPLQSVFQELNRALPRVGGIVGTVTGFVVRVFEPVTRVRINLDVGFLARLL
jgi:quinol monooxygenase YgiN